MISGYKINIQNSVTSQHAWNEQSENEIKQAVTFIRLSKRIKSYE